MALRSPLMGGHSRQVIRMAEDHESPPSPCLPWFMASDLNENYDIGSRCLRRLCAAFHSDIQQMALGKHQSPSQDAVIHSAESRPAGTQQNESSPNSGKGQNRHRGPFPFAAPNRRSAPYSSLLVQLCGRFQELTCRVHRGKGLPRTPGDAIGSLFRHQGPF